MKIEHLAIWTNKLEEMKDFYCEYFECRANDKYKNELKEFESYFLTFEDGARIELMHVPDIVEEEEFVMITKLGIAHFAISLGSELNVRRLTERIREDGYTVLSEVRRTGDGYLESVIEDPEGNCIELTI